jgi:serpin B
VKKLILLTIACIIVCTACKKEDGKKEANNAKPIELTKKQQEKVNVDNNFAFNIFKEVSKANGRNTFFSPLSLNMALGMLYNGASGDTRAEMVQVLGMSDFSEYEINEFYQKMSQALLNIDPLTDIGIANSIWYRNTWSVKQPFIDINKHYFDAMVQALDFSQPDAADVINKWCADKTKNRITEIVEKPIHGGIVMYLINALYFKSKWLFEFDKSQTKQADFTKSDNQTKRVSMMEQETSLSYYIDEHLQCVELPYGNQAFSMVVILPSYDSDIDQLIDYLDNAVWQNIIKNLQKLNVWVKFPRFKIECDLSLNEPVKNVGMRKIFIGGLDNISEGLAVSEIKQKTFVEVNEEGTEAAAVTSIEIRETSSGQGSSIPFFATSPFLYLIKEKSTGAILFIGRMDDPKE